MRVQAVDLQGKRHTFEWELTNEHTLKITDKDNKDAPYFVWIEASMFDDKGMIVSIKDYSNEQKQPA